MRFIILYLLLGRFSAAPDILVIMNLIKVCVCSKVPINASAKRRYGCGLPTCGGTNDPGGPVSASDPLRQLQGTPASRWHHSQLITLRNRPLRGCLYVVLGRCTSVYVCCKTVLSCIQICIQFDPQSFQWMHSNIIPRYKGAVLARPNCASSRLCSWLLRLNKSTNADCASLLEPRLLVLKFARYLPWWFSCLPL